ncbi:MAG: hypothetical protein U0T36_03310 [Saprospiraceae bacterium]
MGQPRVSSACVDKRYKTKPVIAFTALGDGLDVAFTSQFRMELVSFGHLVRRWVIFINIKSCTSLWSRVELTLFHCLIVIFVVYYCNTKRFGTPIPTAGFTTATSTACQGAVIIQFNDNSSPSQTLGYGLLNMKSSHIYTKKSNSHYAQTEVMMCR